MTTPPNRQPEGIPAGGQFAANAHSEPDVSLTPAAIPPAIHATVVLQRWAADGDQAEYVDQVAFDARRILAGLTSEQRAALTDGSEDADEIFRAGVRSGLVADHDGPFEVYVRDAMDEAVRKDPEVFEKIAALPDNRPADAVLDTPLSPYEIGARVDENGFVSGKAEMYMSDLIDRDVEEFNDYLGETLAGSSLLMEANATPVSVQDSKIIMGIEGDASAIIDSFDEDELAQYEAGRAEARAS
jgi:hypothetical protein